MRKRRLKKGAVVVLGTLLCLPAVFGISMYLYAEEGHVYAQEDVQMVSGEVTLKEMRITQNEADVMTCTYPDESEASLCAGIKTTEEGLYRTADMLPGTFVEDTFQPYTYHVKYELSGELAEQEITLERMPGSTQISFPSKTIDEDTWTSLEVVGGSGHITFICEDPLVEIEEDRVKAGKEVTSFQVIAQDAGNETMSGGELSATFTVRHPEERNEPFSNAPATIERIVSEEEGQSETIVRSEQPAQLRNMLGAAMISYDFDQVWWRGSASMTMKLTLNNKNEIFTLDTTTTPGESKPIPNHSVYLQGQFVNIADPDKQLLPGETPENLSEDRIKKLFQGAEVIPGSSFDTSAAYAKKDDINILDDVTWEQQMSLYWPKEEGIYLVRYRLFSSYYGLSIPLDGATGWHYSPDFVFGIDTTLPQINVEAKRTRNTSFHEMKNQEILNAGDEIKISVDADIAGLEEIKYRFIKPEQTDSDVAWSSSKNLITQLTVPADFNDGGMLQIEAFDKTGNGTKNEKSLTFQAPVDHIVLYLPEESEGWTSLNTGTISISEPDSVPDYDGILLSYEDADGKNVHPAVFLSKNDFTDHIYENLVLPDGEYTLHAVAVKGTSAADAKAIDEHEFTSDQMIDATSSLEVSEESIKDEVLPVRLITTVGPSGVKAITATCTYDGQSYTKTIKGNSASSYSDKIYLNGSCTYTLYNKAGLASTPKTVTAQNLNYTFPVLNITAFDSTGSKKESGDEAEKFIRIKAEDINPKTSEEHSHIQICINDVCEDYTSGSEKVIDRDATIVFKNKEDPSQIYGTFEITVTGNIEFGTIHIEKEQEYTKDAWWKEDQIIKANLTQAQENVYLEYAFEDGIWQKTGKTEALIDVRQEEDTSTSHSLQIRAYQGNDTGSRKQIYVNIDKKMPTLAIRQEHNATNSKSIASFTIQVGGSGLASASVKDEMGNKDLSSYIEGNHLKDYPMDTNGTYTFTITAGNGKSATETVTVTGLNENKIHVTALVGEIDKAIAYDGTWTNQTVTFQLQGGLQDMTQFKNYQMRTSKGDWEDCGNTITLTKDQEEAIEFQVILKDGSTSSLTQAYPVKIDKLPPSNPVITLHKRNDNSAAKFLRAISFDTFLKEGREAEITSTDTTSKATIYYQFVDEEGNFDKALTSSKWIRYEREIELDKEGKVAIVAYAVDEAGNPSGITNGEGYIFDFTAPLLHGVNGDSGYIPRTITYEDTLSDLADEQVFTFNGVDTPLAQGTKLKEPGTYHFEISDRAGNVTIKDFTLKPMPNPEDIDGSDETKDIIDEIQDEFEHNKGNLDEDTKKEIQDKIDEIEDTFMKQRTDHLEDSKSGASLDGMEDTTFPKDAILQVRKISEEISEEERATYELYADRLSEKADVQDVYEVKITLDGKELEIHGSAILSILCDEQIERFAYIDEAAMKELQLTNNITGFTSMIEHTGRYATLMEDQGANGGIIIEDEESGASIEGINGTTIPKGTLLRVRKITSDLDKEEKNKYQMQANELSKELQDVYEVTLTYDGKPIALEGSAMLSIPMKNTPDSIAYLQEDEMQAQSFTSEETGIRMEIHGTGRYAMLMDREDEDPNGGNKGSGSHSIGSYFGGGVNTGESTNYGILLAIMAMSFMILHHIRNMEKEKGDER